MTNRKVIKPFPAIRAQTCTIRLTQRCQRQAQHYRVPYERFEVEVIPL
jgi:hypothetical protein